MSKNDTIQAYPLSWPPHRKRTPANQQRRANFHRKVEVTSQYGGTSWKKKEGLTVADSRDRVLHELEALGGQRVVISSNMELRNDGLPRSGQREPNDPGVAVYFEMNKQPHCLSCDTWDRCADNLAAIAKHVEAMRGQLRWGVADVATMFSGFKALPGPLVTAPPMTVEDAARFIAANAGVAHWGTISGFPDNFRSAYRIVAKKFHPDANGGTPRPEWATLQAAEAVLAKHHGI